MRKRNTCGKTTAFYTLTITLTVRTKQKYHILFNVTFTNQKKNQVITVDKYAVPGSLRMSSRQRGYKQTLTFDTDTAV